LLLPELPWTRVAHKFSRRFDGRRFFGIKIRNAASKANGLYLQFSVQFKIDAPSDRKTYIWPDDSRAVPSHEHSVIVPQYFDQTPGSFEIRDKQVRDAAVFFYVKDRQPCPDECSHMIERPQGNRAHAKRYYRRRMVVDHGLNVRACFVNGGM